MTKKEKSKKPVNWLSRLGTALILVVFLMASFIFWPVVKEEVGYRVKKTAEGVSGIKKVPSIPNLDFSIVIPKIDAAAPIVAGVDWTNPSSFAPALKRGVAHARGTAYPDQGGNTYLFAHSTDAFYNVGAFNAVFYLIGKLDDGDEIEIYYHRQKYTYKVYSKLVVGPADTKYLGRLKNTATLTLQTCYPPGTTLKRLVVLADFVSKEDI